VNQAMRVVRSWRWPALAALAVIAAGVLIALLQPSATSGYLDPGDATPTGGRALAALLSARGQQVVRTQLPPGPSAGDSLEFVTSPDLLSGAQLTQAGRFNGDILLVDPDAAALRAIAPQVSPADESNVGGIQDGGANGLVASPMCANEAADLAGTAALEGTLLRTDDPAAQTCYPGFTSTGAVGYSMIAYTEGSRTITILGSGAVLTNQYLADNGDAALALNLMRDNQVVWVVPSIANLIGSPGAPGTGSGQQSFFDLVPWPAYLIAIQLGITVLLAAAWRMRRLGPLVAERLPVIVRASETVEGHGRLYQSRHARGRAAEVLRAGTASRLARLVGGPVTPPGTTSSASTTSAIVHPEIVAARIGEQPTEVARLLYGPPPASDMDLVRLAADLDTLERKIRQS
jgi:hypothetical protein